MYKVSLLEILALAQVDREAANKAAETLVVPWSRQQFPLDALRLTHGGMSHFYEPINQLPKNRSFILDALGGFFVHHDKLSWTHESGTALYNQPNPDLASIVIGRMPQTEIKAHAACDDICGYYVWVPPTAVLDCAYIYVESGAGRVPGLVTFIDGNLPLSPESPIVYASMPISPRLPGLTNKFTEFINVVVPHSHEYLCSISSISGGEGSPPITHEAHLEWVKAGEPSLKQRP